MDLLARGGLRALVYLGPGRPEALPWEAVSFLREAAHDELIGFDLPEEVVLSLRQALGGRSVAQLRKGDASAAGGWQVEGTGQVQGHRQVQGSWCLLFCADHARDIAEGASLLSPPGPTLLVPTGADLRREAIILELELLYDLTATLRRECPWDRAQTLESLVHYTLEETYELVDAVLSPEVEEAGQDHVADELGDLLFQVYFLAQVGEESGRFDLGQVARGIRTKLVRRHPHIFADVTADTPEDVRRNWDRIKRDTEGRTGIFHHVPHSLPSPLLAQKLQARAAEVGFDWPDAAGPLAKVQEELGELRGELPDGAVADEVGDLMFALVNLARKLRVDPELALRGAAQRFRGRVELAADLAARDGKAWPVLSLDEQEGYYQRAKALLTAGAGSPE